MTYPIKTTFNKIVEHGFFTFRKGGDTHYPYINNDCYKDTDPALHINVRDLSGGCGYIKNKRAVVWTEKIFIKD